MKKLVHIGTSRSIREQVLKSMEAGEVIAFEQSFDFLESMSAGPQGISRNSMVLPSHTFATERVMVYCRPDTIIFIDDLDQVDPSGHREFLQLIENAFRIIDHSKAQRSGILLADQVPPRR